MSSTQITDRILIFIEKFINIAIVYCQKYIHLTIITPLYTHFCISKHTNSYLRIVHYCFVKLETSPRERLLVAPQRS